MKKNWKPYLKHPRRRPDGSEAYILVSDSVFNRMRERGEDIAWVPGDPDYPWAVVDDSTRGRIARLHRHVIRVAAELGLRRDLDDRHHVHHVNERKEDCRLENLKPVPPDVHARIHRGAGSPSPAQRRRDRAVEAKGLWRADLAAPAPVTRPSVDVVSNLVPPGTRRSNGGADDPGSRIIACLKAMLPELARQLGPRDSGRPIPRTPGKYTDKRSKQLGLDRYVRHACLDYEAALVGLFVLYKSARDPATGEDQIADAILRSLSGQASISRAVVIAWINRVVQRPAVDLARSRWREYERLPKQLKG